MPKELGVVGVRMHGQEAQYFDILCSHPTELMMLALHTKFQSRIG